MAELSAEDAQRLARQFLTGKAAKADVARLAAALPEDQTLALELLSQMQAALDDVAPSALSVEQDRSVDARIEALIAPRIKKRGLFGWLRKLFARKPKPVEEAAPSRRKKRGADAPPPPPVDELPPPSSLGDDGGLEEMVPIAPGGAPPPPPPAAAEAGPSAVAPPKPKAARKPLPWKALGLGLAALLLLAGLAWAVRAWLQRPRPAAVEAAPVAAPTPLPSPATTPAPTAVPAPAGQPRRVRAVASDPDGPLPAELPPTTPQPAGLLP